MLDTTHTPFFATPRLQRTYNIEPPRIYVNTCTSEHSQFSNRLREYARPCPSLITGSVHKESLAAGFEKKNYKEDW